MKLKLNKNYKAVNIIMGLIFSLLFGYVITAICHLFIMRGPSQQTAVYAAYCKDREQSVCVCPDEKNTYGVFSTGWPFVSGKTVQYPCRDPGEGAPEQYLYNVRDPIGGFWLDLAFWTIVNGSIIFIFSSLKNKHMNR